jgi:predicted DNA-binding transcriptional regulator AlpA
MLKIAQEQRMTNKTTKSNEDASNIQLLSRHQVCAMTRLSYPLIWARMRQGTFPRSRSVGGCAYWLRHEVENWIMELPVRRLKGDKEKPTAKNSLRSFGAPKTEEKQPLKVE